MSLDAITCTVDAFRDPKVYPSLGKGSDTLSRAQAHVSDYKYTLIKGIVLSVLTALVGVCILYFGNKWFPNIGTVGVHATSGTLFGFSGLIILGTAILTSRHYKITHSAYNSAKFMFTNEVEAYLKNEALSRRAELSPNKGWIGFKYFDVSWKYSVTNGVSQEWISASESDLEKRVFIDAKLFLEQYRKV